MYFRSLQVLRGIAAVAVVLYHTNCYLESLVKAPGTSFRVFDTKFSMGAWFFFALSGFLMAYMIDTSRNRFLSRRLTRIYPTLWVAICITLVAKVALFGAVANPSLIRAASLLPFAGKVAYPLSVEWTLIYEIFFYFVCAIFANAWLYRWFPAFLGCWAGSIIIADLAFGHPTLMLPGAGQIVFSQFNLLFIMGGLGFHVYKRLEPTRATRNLLLLTACGGILINTFRGNQALLGFLSLGLSFAATIVWGTLGDRRDRPAPGDSFFEKLGDASYGLYLIHVPIMTCFFVVATQRVGFEHPTTLGLIGASLALVGGWWFGKLDIKLQKSLKKLLTRPRSGDAIPRAHIWRRLNGFRRPAETRAA